MEYNFLAPNCGLKVSAICLGAMTFWKGGVKFVIGATNIGKEDSFKILDRYAELGGNFIDTADVYSEGQSEEIIGEWMKERGNRKDMIIATKCRSNMPGFKPPNNSGLSRKHIMDSVDGSLKRLQTDYIDLYQIHGPDSGTPVKEVIQTMDDLVRAGKIRYVGACNLTGWQMQKFAEVTRQLGCSPWVSLQQHYSLLGRGSEPEAFAVCKNEGMGVMPWGPLRGGLLTGKLKKGEKKAPEGSRMEHTSKLKLGSAFQSFPDVDKYLNDDNYWALMDAMQRIADAHGKTIAQVALRWTMQSPPVTSVIIGTTKMHQLEDNMGAVGWKLTDKEMEELNKLTTPGLMDMYPYNMAPLLADRAKDPPYV